MFEKAIELTFTCLVAPILLEMWKDSRKRKRSARRRLRTTPPLPTESPITQPPRPTGTPAQGVTGVHMFRVILRIIVSAVVGFFPSAFVGGIIQGITGWNAHIGTPVFYFSIIICTAVFWLLLSRLGPLRSRDI